MGLIHCSVHGHNDFHLQSMTVLSLPSSSSLKCPPSYFQRSRLSGAGFGGIFQAAIGGQVENVIFRGWKSSLLPKHCTGFIPVSSVNGAGHSKVWPYHRVQQKILFGLCMDVTYICPIMQSTLNIAQRIFFIPKVLSTCNRAKTQCLHIIPSMVIHVHGQEEVSWTDGIWLA